MYKLTSRHGPSGRDGLTSKTAHLPGLLT